jgi:hypothetical protein
VDPRSTYRILFKEAGPEIKLVPVLLGVVLIAIGIARLYEEIPAISNGDAQVILSLVIAILFSAGLLFVTYGLIDGSRSIEAPGDPRPQPTAELLVQRGIIMATLREADLVTTIPASSLTVSCD